MWALALSCDLRSILTKKGRAVSVSEELGDDWSDTLSQVSALSGLGSWSLL